MSIWPGQRAASRQLAQSTMRLLLRRFSSSLSPNIPRKFRWRTLANRSTNSWRRLRSMPRWPLSSSSSFPLRFTRAHSSTTTPSSKRKEAAAAAAAATASLSLSQRFRKLSREYGYSALGVYLLLSALDFPLCFLAVRHLGTERIGYWEHVALEKFWQVVPWPFPSPDQTQVNNNDDVPRTVGTTKEAEQSLQHAEQINAESDASTYLL